MALKQDRSTLATDISFFMNEAAERGGVVSVSATGFGASMDNGDALVTYAADPSGMVPMGLLVNDMVDIDLTRQHINQHKDEVPKGGKVTLLTKGWVVTDQIEGTVTDGTELAYLGHSGKIAASKVIDDDSSEAGLVIGRFLSYDDNSGFAKVYIDLPNTNV